MRDALLARLRRRAAMMPDAVCLFSHGQRLAWRELLSVASTHARELEKCKVAQSDVVVIASDAAPVVLAQVVGCWLAGAVPAPLPRIVDGQAARHLQALRPAALFAADGRVVRTQAGQAAPDHAAVVLTTSGSTGEPKPVALSWDNLRFMAEFQVAHRGLCEQDLVLTTAPFSVVPSMVNCLAGGLWTGAAVWVIGDYSRVRDELARGPLEQVTLLNSVAEVCASLSRLARSGGLALPGLRAVYSGGSYVSPRVRDECEAVFEVPLVACYGMTECAATIAQQGSQFGPGAGLPVSRDRMYAIPGVALRCVDDDGNPSSRGRVQIRGPNVMLGYLHQPGESAKAMTADGWLVAQDVGSLHPDGGLTLEGRANRVLKVNGYKVSPEEIERLLEDLPQVDGAMVKSVAQGGRARLVATIEGPRELRARELRSYLREHLPAHKVPHRFELGRFSRSVAGKVLRHATPDRQRESASPQ